MKKFSRKNLVVLALTVLSVGSIFAQSKTDMIKSKFGKGISVIGADSSFSLKFSTRFQNLMINEMVLKDDISNQTVSTNLLVRRARIKFSGFVYNPRITYKMELGLSNRDHAGEVPETRNTSNVVMDAVIKYRFAKNTTIWFGQTKLPGNRERVISSQQLQFVDRSLVNSLYNIDRDMGFQLHHKFKIGNSVFKEAAAVSMGEGRNITVGNQGGFEYTGRIEYLPLGEFTGKGDYFGSDLKREKTPKLSIGVTYDHNNNTPRSRGNLGSFLSDTRTLNTVFADLMFKYKGFSAMAEYADKSSAGRSSVVSYDAAGDVDEYFYTGTGITFQAGYLFKKNWELAARYTQIDPSKSNMLDQTKMYTLGFSRYIVGHSLKIQSDISLTQVGNNDPELMHRLQVELAF